MCASAEPLSKCQVLTGLVRTGETLKKYPEERKKSKAPVQNNRSPLSFFACCFTGLWPASQKVIHWLLKPKSEAEQMPSEVMLLFLSPSQPNSLRNVAFGWFVLHDCFLKNCNI